MWIGIEWLGVPSPALDVRGAGRYALELLRGLQQTDAGHRYVLYHPPAAVNLFPRSDDLDLIAVSPPVQAYGERIRSTRQRLVDENPDGLDWLLVVDPLQASELGPLPAPPLSGPRLAALVTELPEASEDVLELSRHLPRRLATLARYDLIFTTGQKIAAALREQIPIKPERVVSLGPAWDSQRYRHVPTLPLSKVAYEFLNQLAIPSAFVLHEATKRASTVEILEAYRRLPDRLPPEFPMVLIGDAPLLQDLELDLWELGLSDRVILVPNPEPAQRAILLQTCLLYVAGGSCEVESQRVAEARSAGAVILISSDAEGHCESESVACVAGLDRSRLAQEIRALIHDPSRRDSLRRHALDEAARVDPSQSPTRFLDAIAAFQSSEREGLPSTPRRTARPRIACFPCRPGASGLTSSQLDTRLEELAKSFSMDLYLTGDERHELGRAGLEYGCFDHREFLRRDRLVTYHGLIYEIGETTEQEYLLDLIRKRPGIVAVEDRVWLPPPSASERPGRLIDSLAMTPSRWVDGMIHSILAGGSILVVESQWAADRVSAIAKDALDRIHVLPWWSRHRPNPLGNRREVRERWGIPDDRFVVVQCGPTPDDSHEQLRAYVWTRSSLEGNDRPGFPAESLQWVAPATREGWLDVLDAADLAIHAGDDVIRPERAITLHDLLRAGLPVVVPDLGWLPKDVVEVVPRSNDPDALANAISRLAADPSRREALGRRARDYAGQARDVGASQSYMADLIRRFAESRPDPRTLRRRWRESLNASRRRTSGMDFRNVLAR